MNGGGAGSQARSTADCLVLLVSHWRGRSPTDGSLVGRVVGLVDGVEPEHAVIAHKLSSH